MWCLYTKSVMSLDEGLFRGTVTLVCPEFGPVDFLGQKKKKKHLKEMATHSSTLVWKIPWMEEPGRLQSTGSQRVGHD